MKYTIELDPYEDRDEWEMHINAHKMCILIHEFNEYMMKIDKHHDFNISEQSMIDRIRARWFQFKEDCAL